MPLQNRVDPFGELISVSARGTYMGNRGIIHNPDTKTLLTRRWQHKAWICCVLSFKDFQHPIMGPNAYTEIFFLDEATALAAGHRPCALCRREQFNAFKRAWMDGNGRSADASLPAPEIDKILHRERVTRKREKVTYTELSDDLPDGVFITQGNQPLLIKGDHVYPWTPDGYTSKSSRPSKTDVTVLTPRTTVAAIAAGYVPEIHKSVQI